MALEFLGIFAGGLLTFASPCILPLVPVYLGLLGSVEQKERTAATILRSVGAAFAFALGLTLVFMALGLAATAFGRGVIAHRELLLQIGGLAVFLFGLKLLGVLQVPWLEREYRPLLGRRGGGLLQAFVLGAGFGLGWTPCIGPVLGSVLTYTASTASSPGVGALYLGAYAAGLTLPLVGAAVIAPAAIRLVRRAQSHTQRVQKVTGALLAVVGVLLITDTLRVLDPTSWLVSGSKAPTSALVVPAPERAGGAAGAPAPVEAAGCDVPASEGSAAACGVQSALPGLPAAGPVQRLPEGPALIEFVSRTCKVCLRMAPVVAAAERGCAGKGVKVHRIEMEAPGGLELARRFGVLGVPTFVFVDAEQREVARLVGEQPLDALEQSLQVLTGQRCSGFRALPPTPAR